MYEALLHLSRRTKRAILLGLDVLLVPIALYIAYALRFGTGFPADYIMEGVPFFAAMTLLSIPVFTFTGLNRVKIMAFELPDIVRAAGVTALLFVMAIIIGQLLDLTGERSIPLIFAPTFWSLHVASRMLGRSFLTFLLHREGVRIPTAIYGAGSAGVQLLTALRQSHDMRPVMFIDDNATLQNMTVAGLPVHSRAELEKAARVGRVRRVLLAMPSANDSLRRRKVQELSELGCEVMALPSYSEILDGSALETKLRPVTPDMLLGRDKVDLDIPEVARTYAGRRVLITGAGGSIGAELCRQILRCNPASLTLLDHSEYALYLIHTELGQTAAELGVTLTPRLGSVCDARHMRDLMRECQIDIVLHAAAYKHVPLVEENELVGVYNNVIGTQVIADAAAEVGVERFILVSSDKAVRPANIMGASKRLAELVIQDRQTRSKKTIFAMVRFGNVLGSSGSVLPAFQRQIAAGGPVQLTHRNMTRYFMTIPESARLVLLAGAFATGGDVFVLDMGKPVNIGDLARRMIELSGRKVRDDDQPDGDIEIQMVGLRPGEKLYEELLIGEDLLPTPHPKILRAQENLLSQIEMARILRAIEAAQSDPQSADIRQLIEDSVDGYKASDAAAGRR